MKRIKVYIDPRQKVFETNGEAFKDDAGAIHKTSEEAHKADAEHYRNLVDKLQSQQEVLIADKTDLQQRLALAKTAASSNVPEMKAGTPSASAPVQATPA